MNTQTNIQTKVIAITGASNSIGEETALLLSALGHTIVLGDSKTDKLADLVAEIRFSCGIADCFALDVTNAENFKEFIDFASEKHGRVDVLINNAGIMPQLKLSALMVDDWNRIIDVNIRGVLHSIAAALPLMEEHGYGHFINIAPAANNVMPAATVHNATQSAVKAISDGLRQETDDNIRVTVINCGAVQPVTVEDVLNPAFGQTAGTCRKNVMSALNIARTIGFVIDQPADVDLLLGGIMV
jgi:NADP-dependent 3-hydroxy acid dehydrogenase YdfG